MGCCCSTTSRVSSVKPNSRSFPDPSDALDSPVVKDRHCTDVFFLIIFAVYVIFLVIGVILAAVQGDPRRLLYGYDNNGNLCGIRNEKINGANESGKDYTELKYLKMGQKCSGGNCQTEKECVKECPEGYENSTLRRCLPSQVTDTTKKIFQFSMPFFEEVGSDISLCWKEIIMLFVISIGLSLLLLLLFRFCAAIIIWAVLLGVTAVSIGVTIYLWYNWNEKKGDIKGYEGPNKDLRERQVTYWLVAAIVSTIFTVIYLLVIVFMRNKIKLVAALFKEAGKSISAMPLILLQPIETFISIAAVCCFLLMGFLCLQTSGKPLVASNGRVTFPIETFFQVMRWLLLFGFIWLTQFVMACQNFVVAGAVVNWFFTRDKHRLSSPISRSLCMLISYHLGSVAFGSLIIAIMKAIRALFRLIQKHMNNQNQRCDIFWKFFQCCLACFENYLKFLSKNAYIMIAINGDSFCASARKSFGSLTANILKIAAVDCIGDFILFVGKMGVTISIALIALEILKSVDGLNHIWIPVSISCAFAFLCCHCFLSVYEMAIDTLMLCFCEDCQMNDGITRPYFMSKSLMTFVENSRRNARISPQPKGKELD